MRSSTTQQQQQEDDEQQEQQQQLSSRFLLGEGTRVFSGVLEEDRSPETKKVFSTKSPVTTIAARSGNF